MLKYIWEHLTNWLETYFFLPLSLLFIWLAVELHWLATGRPAADDPWAWIIDFAPRLVQAILAITLVSISREAFGSWLSKEEKLANPAIAITQSVTSIALCVAFLYFLSH